MVIEVQKGTFELKSAFLRLCFKHLTLLFSIWCQMTLLTQTASNSALPSCKQALTAKSDEN